MAAAPKVGAGNIVPRHTAKHNIGSSNEVPTRSGCDVTARVVVASSNGCVRAEGGLALNSFRGSDLFFCGPDS